MDRRKLLGGVALVALGLWVCLTALALGGVGVETRLPGSDWQQQALLTALAILTALAACGAAGRPWRDMATPYW